MSASTTNRQLVEAIVHATKSARFCVAGCLPAIDPGITIDGLGAVALPLKRGVAKKLIALCQVAPYGKGTKTLVDTSVRKTFELDPMKFRLSQEWTTAVAGAAQLAAGQLGLPAEQVEARLYKLLVYEKGGFFLPHRDSEKHDRMVASLIVVLPNQFEGGRLRVRHGAGRQTLAFEEARAGKTACFAAFYADCEHEVERVADGVRLALAYNLVLKSGMHSAAATGTARRDRLAEAIGSWVACQPAKPLVFALQHHYTQRGLSLELLKGADRRLAESIIPAAENAECLVHLAQVSRHLSQFADDGSLERSYRGRRWGYQPRREIEIGETYEDDVQGDEWTDLQGKKQPWGPMALEISAIVSSIPIGEWKPTSEEFEGYTGNAGNTLDRWYHRSAIVVWQRAQHFDVVASCGAAVSIPLLRSMVSKLAKTPKKRLEEARTDCIRFARAIITRWQGWYQSWRGVARESSPQEDFPDLLPALHDRDTVALFLSKLAEQDQRLRLASLVVKACNEFGWSAFARELRKLITARPDDRARLSMDERHELPERDVEWLSAFCLAKSEDQDKSSLAHELCALAVERFCAPFPPRPAYYRHGYGHGARREPSVSERSLPLLLKALVATGRDEDLARVIEFVERSPNDFSLDDCQVPTLQALAPWSAKQFGEAHPHLVSWLVSVRQQLESATARQPTRPADWSRPSDVACTCQYCAQLKAFLADSASEVGRIAAREDMRQHLVGMIGRHNCDVKYALERKGSPYSLVLTKTTGSFDRATKRFEADGRLLKIVEEVSKGIALQDGKDRR